MAERDFDAERKKRSGHKFTLAGRRFRTFPGIPLAAVRIPKTESDEDKDTIREISNFIRQVIVPEDRKSWDEMIDSPDTYIDAEDIIDVSRWISELIQLRMDARLEQVAAKTAQTNGSAKPKPARSKAAKVAQKTRPKTSGD